MTFCSGSATTGILDADNGRGVVAANRAMDEAIAMAKKSGTGFVAVFKSNHLGYPGYYARKAMKQGLIGLCMSNGGRIETPTSGIEPFTGSNPMSVAIPGEAGGPGFYLDMAIASAAIGKIETYLLLAGQKNPATGHFMGTIDIAGFREPEFVYQQMQETFAKIRGMKKAPGRDRIYIPGS